MGNHHFSIEGNSYYLVKLLDIGIAVLEQNGSAMYLNDFESNLRKKRNFSASTQYIYQKPIIKLKNKMVALDYWDNSNPVLNRKKMYISPKKSYLRTRLKSKNR